MELKDFIENFANQFDDTELSEFKEETIYKELDEWSSLIALSIIAMIDEEFDVALKSDDMKNATTVGDLYEIVKGKVA